MNNEDNKNNQLLMAKILCHKGSILRCSGNL